MRYFIFKDSEIVGPFEPHELGGNGGLSADALVCAESASGRYDNDWIAAGDVAELSGARMSPTTLTALLDEPLAGEEGAFERLELDTAGLPGVAGEGEGWLLDLMDDVEFRQRWGELLPKPSEDAEELAQARISDLTGQLETLRSRISELEILRAARPAPAPVPAFEAPPPARIPPAIASPQASLPAEIKPEISPEPPPAKLVSVPTEAPAHSPAPAPAVAPAPAQEGAKTDFEKRGSTFTFKGKGKAQPQGGARPIKFSPSEAFRVVAREPHPASLPVAGPPEAFTTQGPGPGGTPSVYEWNAPTQPPSSGLPAAGSAPPPAPGPVSVPSLPAAAAAPAMPTPLPAFEMPPALPPAPAAPPIPTPLPAFEAPSALPPAAGPLTSPPSAMTMTPAPAITIAPAAPAASAPATAAPAPSLGLGVPAPATPPPITAPPLTVNPQAPYAPPVTMMFGAPAAAPVAAAGPFSPGGMPSMEPPPIPQMPGFGAPGPVGFGGAVNPMGAMTPSRANEGAVTPVPAADDVVARLAKPAAPAPTDKKPARRKSPVMLIVGVVGLVALFGLIFLFLYHDRRGLKSMVTMGGDQKPIGSVVEDEPKALPPLTKPAAPAAAVSPVPAAAPSGADKIPDAGETAVALVKNYPLAGDRGTVGQWLSYSYNADGGSKEEWNAGAVDATSYAVEYKVQPGANSHGQEAISYLFEADTSRRIVQGKNQAARALLTGGEAPKPKKAAKSVYKRRAKKKAAAAPAPPKKVDILPLPSDSELLPPADDNSSFKADTVDP